MEKNTFAEVKAIISFIDKIKFSLKVQKPECKGIVEQAEKIVEEYILNSRLQGITLYKKRKKFNLKKLAIAICSAIAITAIAYLIFV